MFKVELIFFLNVAVIFDSKLDSELIFLKGKDEHIQKRN